MIAILRAPELSATSRIDRIWIMTHAPRSSFCVRRALFVRRTSNQEPRTTSSLHFDRFPHDPCERPPFAAAHRAGLDDGDHVAGLRFVLLVMDHELRRAPLGLAVQAVPHLPLDGHDAALLHRVAHDHANFLRLFCHFNIPWREGLPFLPILPVSVGEQSSPWPGPVVRCAACRGSRAAPSTSGYACGTADR